MAFPGLSLVLPPYLNRMPFRDTQCFKPQNYGWGKGAKDCKKVEGNMLFSMAPQIAYCCEFQFRLAMLG